MDLDDDEIYMVRNPNPAYPHIIATLAPEGNLNYWFFEF